MILLELWYPVSRCADLYVSKTWNYGVLMKYGQLRTTGQHADNLKYCPHFIKRKYGQHFFSKYLMRITFWKKIQPKYVVRISSKENADNIFSKNLIRITFGKWRQPKHFICISSKEKSYNIFFQIQVSHFSLTSLYFFIWLLEPKYGVIGLI